MNVLLRVRSEFPIFTRRSAPIVYLDNAATTQKPTVVLNALTDFYSRVCSNIHRGAYVLAEEATGLYEEARARLAQFLNAGSPQEIIFTKNTTEAINAVAYAWGGRQVNEGDELVVSVAEHHSNFVPWLELAKRRGARFRVIPLSGGQVTVDAFKQVLSSRTRLVALHHVSNVLGSIAPVREIAAAAHAVGAQVFVDAAQSAARLSIDVRELSCDFLALSGHKMYGPTGIGVLYGKAETLAEMPPFLFGGGMVQEVSSDHVSYIQPPRRFEAGTPPIAEAIGLAVATDFLRGLGWTTIREHEQDLVAYARTRLGEIRGMQLFGPSDASECSGIVSFNLRGIHSHDVATLLGEKGICIRAGFHCAQPLMRELGVSSTCRVSFGVYNTREDIDSFSDALQYVCSVLGGGH